jgi:hypothetical protein
MPMPLTQNLFDFTTADMKKKAELAAPLEYSDHTGNAFAIALYAYMTVSTILI